MAEAVGLAASILAIIELASKATTYLQGIKDAPKERRLLLAEIVCISGLLSSFKNEAWSRGSEEEWAKCTKLLTCPGGPIEQLQSLMGTIWTKLMPNEREGRRSVDLKFGMLAKIRSRVVAKELLWPFQRQEIIEIITTLERYKTWIQLGLINDHAELSRRIAGSLTTLQFGVRDIANEIGIMKIELTTEVNQTNQTLQEQQILESRKEVLEWLSPLSFQGAQADAYSCWERGTGSWLLANAAFQEWLDGDKPTLYCPGIPGAGKTILTSMVIHYLQKELKRDRVGITFAYFNYKAQAQQTATNILGSLLQQLALDISPLFPPILPPALVDLWRTHNNLMTRPSLSDFADLLRFFIPQYKRIFIVLDAMDECLSDEREELLAELQHMMALGNVSLMVTSRDVGFEGNLLFTSGDRVDVKATDRDVRVYLETRIQKKQRLLSLCRKDPLLRSQIVDKIAQKAHGMFLLAKLNMDTVATKHTLKQVREALQSLPDGLNDTYDVTMKRIQSQGKECSEVATRVLMWVTGCLKPLTVDALRHALATEPGATKLDPDALLEESSLVAACCGLIAIDGPAADNKRYVRLVHYTAQEYFDRYSKSLFPNMHTSIAAICITYLSFDDFSELCGGWQDAEERAKRYALLKYAARNWGTHVRFSDEHQIIQYLALDFLYRKRRNLFFAMQVVLAKVVRRSFAYSAATHAKIVQRHFAYSMEALKLVAHDSEPVLVAASFGMANILRLIMDTDKGLSNFKSSSLQTPLSIAARKGHTDIVKWLCTRPDVETDCADTSTRTPFMWAAAEGHADVVELLLAREDVDPRAECKNGETALSLAAAGGHENVMRILIARPDIDPNVKEDAHDRTVLTLMASSGSVELVKLLLTREDIRPDIRDDDGRTPLSWAASKGHTEIVEILLTRDDVDPNSQADWGQTPIWLAAHARHTFVVRLLLSKPEVKPDLPDDLGHSPLSIASKEGHLDVVTLLLAHDAGKIDINSSDQDGNTPLSLAVKYKHLDIIRVLLAHPSINPNSQNRVGETAFHIASRHGYVSCLQILLTSKGDPDLRSHNGNTPLCVASSKGHSDIVQLLLALPVWKVNCVVQNSKGKTPLSCAVTGGHKRVVKALLQHEIVRREMNVPDVKGRTPKYLAAKKGRVGIGKLLERAATGW